MTPLICAVAFGASLLTLFSGFGLGSLLLPAFAAFFPLKAAVAMTALVHLANNLFKLALLGRRADLKVALRFGLTAVPAAYAGALLLAKLPPVPLRLTVGGLMMAFAVLETSPALEKRLASDHLEVGGLLSGFFGGLAGHQGALRSAFLIRCGLSHEAYVATGVVIACLVDLARLSVYGLSFSIDSRSTLIAAAASAFAGAWLGSRLLKKVTMEAVRRLVAVMLFLFGAGVAAGLL